MKTKNIFKTLAFAMMMPAMLLTTACSSSDDAINNTENTETVNTKGYAIPVTVNVTRQGDDATRATYDDNTKTLSFSVGDKLFVKGSEEDAGIFAGTLDYVSDGTFSGIIYSSEPYSGTADELLTAATTRTATLLPAGYESYGFLTVSDEGRKAKLATDYTKAFATSKAAAVEQFSLEQASTYSNSFALAPQNAILNFTINGLAAKTEVAASFTDDNSKVISGNVTTNGDGTATFGIGIAIASPVSFHSCSLTVGGNPIALATGFKDLTAVKIYNVTRSVATATGHALSSAVVGDIICTDGQAYNGYDYNHLPDGVTAVAKVCYVSDGHGLALALTDEPNTKTIDDALDSDLKTPKVDGCTWILADNNQLYNMMITAGGYVKLRDGFSFVGGTNMRADYYWDNSFNSDQWGYGYCRNFSDGGRWYEGGEHYVRYCLSW